MLLVWWHNIIPNVCDAENWVICNYIPCNRFGRLLWYTHWFKTQPSITWVTGGFLLSGKVPMNPLPRISSGINTSIMGSIVVSCTELVHWVSPSKKITLSPEKLFTSKTLKDGIKESPQCVWNFFTIQKKIQQLPFIEKKQKKQNFPFFTVVTQFDNSLTNPFLVSQLLQISETFCKLISALDNYHISSKVQIRRQLLALGPDLLTHPTTIVTTLIHIILVVTDDVLN